MEEGEKFKENFIKLLKLFRDRPNHLSEYLNDNNSFNKKFKNKIIKSDFLNSISLEKVDDITNFNFKDFSEMNNFFNDIIKKTKKEKENIEIKLNEKLRNLIDKERFEEAAKLRDYMKKKKYKIYLKN